MHAVVTVVGHVHIAGCIARYTPDPPELPIPCAFFPELPEIFVYRAELDPPVMATVSDPDVPARVARHHFRFLEKPFDRFSCRAEARGVGGRFTSAHPFLDSVVAGVGDVHAA